MSVPIGSRLRHVATVYVAGRSYSWVMLTCGHTTTRSYTLATGQRVFCSDCRIDSPTVSAEERPKDAE